MAADVLEFTSHGYNGYVYNADNERVPFMGYRADCINNFAIDFLHGRKEQTEPFFLFISQIEPHHQNDRRRYEGPDGSRAQFADFQPPGDLAACSRACAQGTDVSNWRENYPDYLGCCHSLDYNVGRLVDTLKEQGMWENTILVYTADHGSHFLTRGREAEYKRTCHDASIHIPLIITGPGFKGGNVVENVVSLLDVPATLLACAGIERPEGFRGRDLRVLTDEQTPDWDETAFLQISESRVGRAIRTPEYTYAVRAPGDGYRVFASDVYYEEFFYVLKEDPYQQNNLAADPAWAQTRAQLAQVLCQEDGASGRNAAGDTALSGVVRIRREAMSETKRKGRVTIPTDVDVVPETLEILERWGADAIRDCDGTDYPEALKSVDAKVYSTYYTTRKDNAWAKANPDEVQQCYIMTGFHTAVADSLSIPLMQGISPRADGR